MNARLSLLLAASLCLHAASAGAWDFTLRDGLRGSTMGNAMGGAFSAEGWTVTTKEDAIWYAVPRLGEGYVEFTVSGISRANLPLSDHEIFSMYEAGYGISEPIRYAPEFRENHYKCLLRIFGVPETPRIGQQKLMWGMCPSGAPGYGSCGCGSFFEEPFGGDGNWDGTPQRMRIEWGSGQTRLLRNGAQAVVVRWASSGLQFGPDTLHLMLGSSRNRAVADSGMPIGARFSDLVVEGNMTARAVCTTPMDSGVAPIDSGVVGGDSAACSASAAPTIAGYIPSATSGTQAVFRATYAHCAGASAIRVAQLWVGPTPAAGANSVSVAYEAGVLSLDGQSCAPGEARVLAGTHGSLDCARTTVTDAGTTRLITWALTMSPATLGGAQGVFADAKANTAMPEPRLGWTRLGDFEVRADVPVMDGGASSDASASDATAMDVADASRRDAGGATVEGGCGCRAAGTSRPRGALVSLGWAALAFALTRRGRSRRSQAHAALYRAHTIERRGDIQPSRRST